jgi:hypothetical protein
LVKNLKTMRDTSILMIVVFCLSFVVLGPMHFVKKAVGVMICFHVLSLSRFIGAILLWTYALRLAPDELCLSEKTMTGVTVMWVVVPLADHCWRAVFSY